MTGRNQHYIPQVLLRGFAAGGTGRNAWVYVFRNGCEPEKENLRDVGAEEYFYSNLATGGTDTLDDQITRYERRRLARIVRRLQIVEPTMQVDASDAAELVNHLTIRGAHFRNSFTDAAQVIVQRSAELLSPEAVLSAFLDERDIPGVRFDDVVDSVLNRDARLHSLGIPEKVIRQILRTYLAENRDVLTQELGAGLAHLPDALGDLSAIMRGGHNSALALAIGRSPRSQQLESFHWNIVSQEQHLVLSDCVALARGEGSHDLRPLILSELPRVRMIVMPVASRRLLVGRKTGDAPPSIEELNLVSATCSHSFFVAARCSDNLRSLQEHIGKRNRRILDQTINEAIEEAHPTSVPQSASVDTELEPNALSGDDRPKSILPKYSVTFRAWPDRSSAEAVSQVVLDLVAVLSEIQSLERLDGLTLAYDYADALRELDRGYEPSRPLVPRDDEIGVGIAQVPLVLREGIRKKHVVMHGAVASALVSEDETDQRRATYMLAFELLLVAHFQLVDEALGARTGLVIDDPYEAILFPYADGFLSGYFAARGSAPIFPEQLGEFRESLSAALSRAIKGIPAAKLAYRQDNDMDALLRTAFGLLSDALQFAAQLFGHCDGSAGTPDPLSAPLRSLVAESGLQGWLSLFQQEMRKGWSRRGKWTSLDELYAVNRFLERGLWQFGLVPWRVDDGLMYVRVL